MKFSYLIKQLILPIVLLIILSIIFLFGDFIDHKVKQAFLTISLCIKGLILLILPFFIIVFIADALAAMKKNAVSYFIILISFIIISNFTAVIFGYSFFQIFSSNNNELISLNSTTIELTPLFKITNFQIISNSTGLIIGFIVGIFLTTDFNVYKLDRVVHKLQKKVTLILKYFILPCLPLLIAGLAFKIQHEKVLSSSIGSFSKVFLYFVLSQAIYIGLIILAISKFNLVKCLSIVSKFLPATITGFSTFSSAVTMPVTIECAQKLLVNKDIANSFIPATVNIHLIGTAIGMNIIILSCLNMFNLPLPNLWEFLPFAFYYVIMLFAAVGVPGGSIFVIAPLIEQHLGGSAEIVALVTTLVLLFDPIDTSFNVTANTLMSKVFERTYGFFNRIKGSINLRRI